MGMWGVFPILYPAYTPMFYLYPSYIYMFWIDPLFKMAYHNPLPKTKILNITASWLPISSTKKKKTSSVP